MYKDDGKSKRTHKILSAEEIANGKDSRWTELEISGTVRNLSPKIWCLHYITHLYLNENILTKVPAEITNLTSLVHLDLSKNMLRNLPPHMGDLVTLRELYLNNNYLRMIPFELGKLFQLQVFNLDGNPLAPDFESIYSEPQGPTKILQHLLDKLNFPKLERPERKWISVNSPDKLNKNAVIFTVMTYNVLSEKYGTRQAYGYCPSWALNWDYRKRYILNDILNQSADIVCLQEVVMDEFHHFFLPEMKKDGYEGVFFPKSRAKTMSESEAKTVDGCATFYKTRRFTLVKEHPVEFNQLAMEKAKMNGASKSEEFLNRVMTRDNIGLVCLFEFKDAPVSNGYNEPPKLMVSNLHIHWDPEFCDVKLIQVLLFMNELKRIAENVPLVLCGDLNSLPQSGVIHFIEHGYVPFDHADFKDIDYKQYFKGLSSDSNKLPTEVTHKFGLSSAYDLSKIPYTNFTYDFKGVIDYIFYSKSSMKPLGVLGPINLQWFKDSKIIGCPHPSVPSDHISLTTELEMTFTPTNHTSENSQTSSFH